MAVTYFVAALFSILIALIIHGLNSQTLDALHAQKRRQRFLDNASVEELKQMDENRKRQKETLRKTAKVIGAVGAVFCVLLLFDIFSNSPSSSTGRVTCGYCKKSYSITSSDGKKISRTRLCNSCYAFYDSASEVLGD